MRCGRAGLMRRWLPTHPPSRSWSRACRSTFRRKPSGRRSSAAPEPRSGSTSFTFGLRSRRRVRTPRPPGSPSATACSSPSRRRPRCRRSSGSRIIYPRYVAPDPSPAPSGLSVFGFREGTPYRGEDLAFDPVAPERFLARCARASHPLTPATCLYERRVGDADVTVRFPRDWLESWRDVAAGLDQLIGQLRPAGGS